MNFCFRRLVGVGSTPPRGFMANKNYLTLKALIAIIFLLIGLQYLNVLQVNEKRRGPRYDRLNSYV